MHACVRHSSRFLSVSLISAAAVAADLGSDQIYVSDWPSVWGSPVATGTFPDTAMQKTVYLGSATGRYLRLRALSEAGNPGPWTSVAEITAKGMPAG